MFILKGRVASNSPTDLEDSAIIKMALTSLGYYDDTETGLSPYGDKKLFKAVKSFQNNHNLKVDGVINPDGPTQKTMKEKLLSSPQAAGAFKDFVKNWWDMRQADTKNADKYFHCKANHEATLRGWLGKSTAEYLSDERENIGRMKSDYSLKDEIEDQKANRYGRKQALSNQYKSSSEACAIFRPQGLNEKY